MFEEGFNQCDIQKIEGLLSERFEFYHDKDGIVTTRNSFAKTVHENLCSTGKNTVHRKLDKGSMEVFALYDNEKLYGAIQTGRHYFGNTVARFTHLWRLENNEWVASRMMSYDHILDESPTYTDITFIKLSQSEMSKYLGSYKFSPEFVLVIMMNDGKLYGEADGQKVELKPYGNHQFLDQDQRMKLQFIVDSSGDMSELTIQGPNGDMYAKKVN